VKIIECTRVSVEETRVSRENHQPI